MGSYVEVKCNCPNRIPVGRPHEPGYRYACGHLHGTLFLTSPNDLFSIGRALFVMARKDRAFARDFDFSVYQRIADFTVYDGEYLPLSFDERDLWELETEELLKFVFGESWFTYTATQTWNEHWQREEWDAERWGTRPRPVKEALIDAVELCTASRKSERAIEFYL